MANVIKFLLNDEPVSVSNVNPSCTVLDYLRETEGLTGTKEGCREGDCGACTVTQVQLCDGEPKVRAINACIQFLPSLHGTAIYTVEGLADCGGKLHPVQEAMVECHASQCGFCTPGFVMSLHAASLSGECPDKVRISELLAGNLCRCTGYGPIYAAAQASLDKQRSGPPVLEGVASKLAEMRSTEMLSLAHFCDRRKAVLRYCAPLDLDQLLDVLAKADRPTLLGGGTDIGLWVTKQHQTLHEIIDVTRVKELSRVESRDDALTVGAAVTYSDARKSLAALHPALDGYLSRLASEQIRNAGTVGGNIANGSPIGDMPPVLIALGASIALASKKGSREVALEDFFLEYGKQDRADDEVLTSISISRLSKDSNFAAYKISKRFDQDISSVCAGFHLAIRDGMMSDVRLAFGGMAGVPKRAASAEAELEGKELSQDAFEVAAAALALDFKPLTDHRASSRYRTLVSQSLLRKFYCELSGSNVPSLDRAVLA